MGFGFEAGFFLGIRVSLMIVGRDRYIRTTRLTCSGVRGFDGSEPEWVARGGVVGRSAMMRYMGVNIAVLGNQALMLPDLGLTSRVQRTWLKD